MDGIGSRQQRVDEDETTQWVTGYEAQDGQVIELIRKVGELPPKNERNPKSAPDNVAGKEHHARNNANGIGHLCGI